MRTVLDTSVIVAAVRSRSGASNRLLEAAFARSFQVLATPALYLEYEDVLNREEHRSVHGMSPQRTQEFLAVLADIIEPVSVYYQWRPQMQDANDEMVLETAINGRAAGIVTHNIKDFALPAARFNLRILSPADLIKELSL